jgi:5-methylthioadenosine/S-adenosylhomocysteine deaminase
VSLLVRNGLLVTMNDAFDVVRGDLWIQGNRIEAVGSAPTDARPATIVDAAGGLVLPGFVQTHLHLCQTLFRGSADDRPLLAWLRERIWPLEAAHDEITLAAAARLAAAELILGGTTSVLTMETVHDTDAVFEALAPTGLRAVVGKCLMALRGEAPARLHQPWQAGLDESRALAKRWHGAANGRLMAALAPRFAISCSRDLLEATAALSAEHGWLVHTHASEQRDEVAAVRASTGMNNIEYLASVGLATPRLCAAHCVHVTEPEQQLLATNGVKVLHCPGSNLKLSSGVAPVTEMRALGISVSLGADGAACNNTLDMFQEMRLAATLQAMRLHAGALTATQAVWMATREGARALGLEAEIGSLEPGKKADVIVVRTDQPHHQPAGDPYSLLVYSCRPQDVRATIIDGHVVARDGSINWADLPELAADSARARQRLGARAGL